ncbi:MAG: hypothetical protein GWN46_17050, partial [Gammaproteobacteria bacterium]|nr:hypothetical protein [Gammaproteobacteria bacterium]
VYTVEVRDRAAGELITMNVYVGTWRGVIVGQDDEGRPVAEGLCTAC